MGKMNDMKYVVFANPVGEETIAIFPSCILLSGIIVSPFVAFFLIVSVANSSFRKVSLSL